MSEIHRLSESPICLLSFGFGTFHLGRVNISGIPILRVHRAVIAWFLQRMSAP